jgi:hypothetical protein
MSLIIRDIELKQYLSRLFHKEVFLKSFKELGRGVLGITYLIEVNVAGKTKLLVLKLGSKGFGQDFPADRASTLIYANSVYNTLPHHVRCYDVGAVFVNGSIESIGKANDFFLLMDFVEGLSYARDLDRIKETGTLTKLDKSRVDLLAKYEATIHATKCCNFQLYSRRIRDLVGRGDCITGIIDSYPKDERTFAFTSEDEFEQIEKTCIRWRWKIKDKAHRLCQVHGDIHPYNILWQGPLNFVLLDRSRGEWGEAADDVSCLSINYIFWSLMATEQFGGPFQSMFDDFFERYLNYTHDMELLQVIQLFFAFRCLVIAHPLFYPDVAIENRRRIFNFLNAVLKTEEFDYKQVPSYLKG